MCLFHVQGAASNRWAPGCGHLDFAEVLGTLKAMNYQGYVSVECLPKPDPERCPRIAIATLRKAARLRSYGNPADVGAIRRRRLPAPSE